MDRAVVITAAVITPRSPLGQSLIGRHPGDETGAKDSPLAVEILAVD